MKDSEKIPKDREIGNFLTQLKFFSHTSKIFLLNLEFFSHTT